MYCVGFSGRNVWLNYCNYSDHQCTVVVKNNNSFSWAVATGNTHNHCYY